MLTCCLTNDKYLLSGIIIAGGKALRMNGLDKGLVLLNKQPMITRVINHFSHHCDEIIISANRHLDDYQQWQYAVYPDIDFIDCGPLAGLYQCLLHTNHPYILISPCDTPYLPQNYADKLFQALCQSSADVAISQYQGRLQYAHFLIKNHLTKQIKSYLEAGNRSLKGWHEQQPFIVVDFKTQPHDFKNINSLTALQRLSENTSA